MFCGVQDRPVPHRHGNRLLWRFVVVHPNVGGPIASPDYIGQADRFFLQAEAKTTARKGVLPIVDVAMLIISLAALTIQVVQAVRNK